MSFSSDVKKELLKKSDYTRHCNIAELSSIVNVCGKFFYSKDNLKVKIQTENINVVKKTNHLINSLFHLEIDFVVVQNEHSNRKSYILTIENFAYDLLLMTGIMSKNDNVIEIEKRVEPLIVKKDCCKKAYIRGAFLVSGSVIDPKKAYHLEFVNTDLGLSKALSDIINYFGLYSKIIERKGYFVVYLKEGEQIVDLLNIIGAHISLLEFENVRIIKDVRNKVNRIVNCETANINKTVKASIIQVDNINFIDKTKGLSYLSKQLEEVAKIRLSFPDSTLKEIGEMLLPPVSKSGVNHRLKKINEIAENLKGGINS